MMMGMSRVMGVYSIIPTSLLLAVSFFILAIARKLEAQALKTFGYVVAALLWLCALLTFSCGIFTLATGKCPMLKMKHMMMGHGPMKDMPAEGGKPCPHLPR